MPSHDRGGEDGSGVRDGEGEGEGDGLIAQAVPIMRRPVSEPLIAKAMPIHRRPVSITKVTKPLTKLQVPGKEGENGSSEEGGAEG